VASEVPTLVTALQNETVVNIFAGSLTSYALTVTGKIYEWGLIFSSSNLKVSDESQAASSGTLTGLAADGDNVIFEDKVARGLDHIQDATENGPRLLRDIVAESTERWMLSNDNSDEDYYKELIAIGFKEEECQLKMQSRIKEYNEMSKINCFRKPTFLPSLIILPSKVKVVAVSAGYAHTVLLTDMAQMYSSGYHRNYFVDFCNF
jgi:alpha-tubulin suppressor-like RCC1 family protein